VADRYRLHRWLAVGVGITPASLLVITKDGEKRVMTAKVGMLGEILKAAMPEVLEYL
jgi:hypothetical protein